MCSRKVSLSLQHQRWEVNAISRCPASVGFLPNCFTAPLSPVCQWRPWGHTETESVFTKPPREDRGPNKRFSASTTLLFHRNPGSSLTFHQQELAERLTFSSLPPTTWQTHHATSQDFEPHKWPDASKQMPGLDQTAVAYAHQSAACLRPLRLQPYQYSHVFRRLKYGLAAFQQQKLKKDRIKKKKISSFKTDIPRPYGG